MTGGEFAHLRVLLSLCVDTNLSSVSRVCPAVASRRWCAAMYVAAGGVDVPDRERNTSRESASVPCARKPHSRFQFRLQVSSEWTRCCQFRTSATGDNGDWVCWPVACGHRTTHDSIPCKVGPEPVCGSLALPA